MTTKTKKTAKAAQEPVTFDIRGAVTTADLLEQMNAMANHAYPEATRIDMNDPSKLGAEAVADALKSQ